MYEVTCPRCARDYDVAEDAAEAACPECHLKVDLLTEEEARARNIAVPEAVPEPAPEPEAPSVEAGPDAEPEPDDEFVEVPCPACDGPLLLADEDKEGMCPHCRIALVFDHGTARVLEPEPEQVSVPPAAPAAAPEPATEPAPAVAPRFDPKLVVTSEMAPVVVCRHVPPEASAEDGPGPDEPGESPDSGPPGAADRDAVVDEDVELEADEDNAEEPVRAQAEMRRSSVTAGPAFAPAPEQESVAPPAARPEERFHAPMMVTTAMAPLVEVGENRMQAPEVRAPLTLSSNGTSVPAADRTFPVVDEHVTEVFAALDRDSLAALDPAPVEESLLAFEPESDLEWQPEPVEESLVALEPEPVVEAVAQPEPKPEPEAIVAPIAMESESVSDPPETQPVTSDEAPMIEVGESHAKPAPPAKAAASVPRRPKKGEPVERVVDPEQPDGIPLAVHGKPIKDVAQSRLVDCPECTHPFRHHERDPDLQCPHCGRFFEVVPDEEVAPPPAKAPEPASVAPAPVEQHDEFAPEIELEEEPLVAAEPEPELDLEEEPELELVPEPEPKPELDLEEEPLVVSEPEPEPELDLEEEPLVVSEPEPEPEQDLEEEPPVVSEAEPEPELDLEEEPLVVSEAEPEPELDLEEEPLVVSEAEPELDLEEEPELELAPEPEPEPELDLEEEPLVAAEAEPELDLEEEPELELVPEPEPEPEAKLEEEPLVAAEPEPEFDLEEEPVVAAAPEPELDLEEEPELDLGPEPESEAQPPAAAEPEPDPESAAEEEPPLAAQVHAEEPEPLAGPALESFAEDEDVDGVPTFGVEEVDAEGDEGPTRTVSGKDR